MDRPIIIGIAHVRQAAAQPQECITNRQPLREGKCRCNNPTIQMVPLPIFGEVSLQPANALGHLTGERRHQRRTGPTSATAYASDQGADTRSLRRAKHLPIFPEPGDEHLGIPRQVRGLRDAAQERSAALDEPLPEHAVVRSQPAAQPSKSNAKVMQSFLVLCPSQAESIPLGAEGPHEVQRDPAHSLVLGAL
jgi:hypothetical protein